MNARKIALVRGLIPMFIGFAALGVSVYFLLGDALLVAERIAIGSFSPIAAYFVVTVPLLVSAMFCLYVASAFLFGYVDEVTGEVSSAVVERGGLVVWRGALGGVRMLGGEFAISGRRVVYFRIGLRPFVCLEGSFQADGRRQDQKGSKGAAERDGGNQAD